VLISNPLPLPILFRGLEGIVELPLDACEDHFLFALLSKPASDVPSELFRDINLDGTMLDPVVGPLDVAKGHAVLFEHVHSQGHLQVYASFSQDVILVLELLG
jgi:hypothetical protein